MVASWCDDRRLARKLLSGARLSVPRWRLATFDEADEAFLDEMGTLAIKPLHAEGGKGVTLGVVDAEGLETARAKARNQSVEVVLEEHHDGRRRRLVVLDDEHARHRQLELECPISSIGLPKPQSCGIGR